MFLLWLDFYKSVIKCLDLMNNRGYTKNSLKGHSLLLKRFLLTQFPYGLKILTVHQSVNLLTMPKTCRTGGIKEDIL